MDINKFEELIKLVIKQKPSHINYLYSDDVYKSKINNILNIASSLLPEHDEFIDNCYKEINKVINYSTDSISIVEAIEILEHLLEIINIEKMVIKPNEKKLFENSFEKYKKSSLLFEEGDYPSCFNNLNSSLEMILKEKIGIPSTITSLPTSNIIDKLVKYKIEPYIHLNEARKRILEIDNKVKHQGYNPTKIDAINGLKIMEELLTYFNKNDIILPENVRNEIYEIL